MSSAANDPAAAYGARRDAARARMAELERLEDRIAAARLLTFTAAGVLALLSFGFDLLPGATLAAPLVAFVLLVARHARLRRDHARALRRAAFHERGLANLDGTWPAAAGDQGARYADPKHPYVDHLDVFGRGSLFHRISTSRTAQGAHTLARWLAGGAGGDVILARQAAVAELRPRLDLREELALLGEDAAAGRHLGELPQWGEAPARLGAAWVRPLAFLLPALALAGLVCAAFDLGWWLFLGALAAEAVFWNRVGPQVEVVLAQGDAGSHDLELLAALLARIDAEPFEAPLLRALDASLNDGAESAERRIVRLRALAQRHDWMKNQMFAPLGGMLLWPVHVALAMERWRARSGGSLRAWLAAVGEMEALCSLSGYAYENPSDTFPRIVEGGARFVGTGLGHPLLPAGRCVRNDVALHAERRVLVVSGSNMSGKSTLLRTVGTNAVLALAGAPVRAASLELTPVTLGASIQVHDSLLDGESRFYAEVARVAQVVRLARAGGPPLLFLLDELFHGTNSSDRRTGAAGVVRALIADGAIGLLTTHDLELARIAEDLDAHVVNVHFEDQFEEGRMTFDYHMRPGVVLRSNALALMRAVGLDV